MGNVEQVPQDCRGCDGYGRRIAGNGKDILALTCTLEGCRGHLPHKTRIPDEILFGETSTIKTYDVDASGRRRGTKS